MPARRRTGAGPCLALLALVSACAPLTSRLLDRGELDAALRNAAVRGREDERREVAAAALAALQLELVVRAASADEILAQLDAAQLDADTRAQLERAFAEQLVVVVVESKHAPAPVRVGLALAISANGRRLQQAPIELEILAQLSGEHEQLASLRGGRAPRRGRTLLEGVVNVLDWVGGGGEYVGPSSEARVRAAPVAAGLRAGFEALPMTVGPEGRRWIALVRRPEGPRPRLELELGVRVSSHRSDNERLERALVDIAVANEAQTAYGEASVDWRLAGALELDGPAPSWRATLEPSRAPERWSAWTEARREAPPGAEPILIGRRGWVGPVACSRFTGEPGIAQPSLGRIPIVGAVPAFDRELWIARGRPLTAAELEPPPLAWDLDECREGEWVGQRAVFYEYLELPIPAAAEPSAAERLGLPAGFEIDGAYATPRWEFMTVELVGEDAELSLTNPVARSFDALELELVYADCKQSYRTPRVIRRFSLPALGPEQTITVRVPLSVPAPEGVAAFGSYAPEIARVVGRGEGVYLDFEEEFFLLGIGTLDELNARCVGRYDPGWPER